MKPGTKRFWMGALIAATILCAAGCKRADNTAGVPGAASGPAAMAPASGASQ